MYKKCVECLKTKSIIEFYKSSGGHESVCKVCRSKLNGQPRKKKKCIVCGSIFIASRRTSKHCSQKCTSITNQKNIRNNNKDKKCKVCKKVFSPYRTTEKYCSQKCLGIDYKTTRLNKNNPSYRNGDYCKSSKTTSKGEVIFLRNRKIVLNNIIEDYGCPTCENCGTSNSLRFEMHHLIYRSEKPLHKHLHDTENLILLCIKCHNEFHINKGIRNDIVNERQLHKLFGTDILNK